MRDLQKDLEKAENHDEAYCIITDFNPSYDEFTPVYDNSERWTFIHDALSLFEQNHAFCAWCGRPHRTQESYDACYEACKSAR